MRKAVGAALVSVGILAGVSGSANAQIDPFTAITVWLQTWQKMQELQQSGKFGPPIGNPATPVGSAGGPNGVWCIVGPPNAPRTVRQMADPFRVRSQCTNESPFGPSRPREWGTVY